MDTAKYMSHYQQTFSDVWEGRPVTYQAPQPPGGWQAPRPQPTPQQQQKRPWWKALWVLPAAALIVGLAIGAGTAGASKNTSAKPGPTVTATATTTMTTKATVTAHPVIRKVIATHTTIRTHTYTPPPPHQYGEGTYVVGTDIKPGTYHSSGGDDCYWARLASLDTTNIIDNGNTTGPTTIQVKASDKALEISGDCTFGRLRS